METKAIAAAIIVAAVAYFFTQPRFAAVRNDTTGAVYVLDLRSGEITTCFQTCASIGR